MHTPNENQFQPPFLTIPNNPNNSSGSKGNERSINPFPINTHPTPYLFLVEHRFISKRFDIEMLRERDSSKCFPACQANPLPCN
ncbi:hypothetical protein TNIN_317021 [Trichonephila inaurata madagascariensis]|uniref:Uncharacterized protein n=1 Tax=Trichonephila inaurata madagascariensis TaxID=2747483 RepID=A0A8X6YG92_9ARAC|nr:hypothetical protein TNIN_317021 [Trichonephila inaurata madagascariensis]